MSLQAFLQSMLDPRGEVAKSNAAGEGMPTIGGFAQNALSGVKNLATGIIGLPGRALQDVQNPAQGGQDIENLIKGTASSVNDVLGQPVATQNGQITGLQVPSVAEVSHHMYNDPLGSALTLGGIGEGVGALKGRLTPGVKTAPEALPAKPGLFTKNDVNEAVPSDIAKNPYAQEDIAPMQDALRKYNISNASQASQGLKSIYDNVINPELKNNPQVVPLDDVTGGIVQEMKKMQPGLDTREAMNAAHRSIIDMYNVGKNTTENIVPSGIGTSDLLNLKTAANQTLPVKNFYNNGVIPTSPTDLGTLAASKALTKIVAKYHPNIAEATRDYGLINDAYPSLYKASQLPPTNYLPPAVNALLPPQAATKVNTAIPNIMNSTKQVGVGMRGVGTSGMLPLAGSTFAGSNNPSTNVPNSQSTEINSNQSDHNTSITQSGVNSTGARYNVPSPQSQGLAMTVQDYANKKAQVQKIIEEEKLNNPQQASIDQGKLDAWDTQQQATQPLAVAYVKTNQALGFANQAYNLAQSAAPDLLSLNGSYDKLRKSTDPKYTQLYTTLQALQGATGIDLSASKTKDDLLANIDQAASIATTQYQATLQQQIGGNTINPGNTTTNLPETPPDLSGTPANVGQVANYDFKFGGGQNAPSGVNAF